MNSSENSYLNLHPQDNRAEDSRPMKDSPIPKLTHSRCEPSTGREDPISPIEEEDSIESLSKTTTPAKTLQEINFSQEADLKANEVQSPSSQGYKQKMAHFMEPSENDFIFTSAQRVRINEFGEQVVDISWTEFKKKCKENFSSKISTPTQTSSKDLKVSMSQNKSPIRRSKRLADIKSQTCEKRKAMTDTKKIKKIKR